MKNEPASTSFDCVRSMREIRDRLDAEIAELSYEELVARLHRRRTDPLLREIQDKARSRAGAEASGA